MADALVCERCGAELPPQAASGPVQCAYCGATSVPAPRVVEKVRDRVVVVEVAAGAGVHVRAPGVQCPRCWNEMDEKQTPEHTFRGCRSCGGAFLEPQTVTALESARDEAILQAVKGLAPLISHPMDRRARVKCPFCKVELTRKDLGETGHSIQTCATHGSFFDRDAVTAFADLHRDQRAGEVHEADLENAGIKKGWW